MSDWRCIASNPLSGVSTWVKYEEDGVLVQERQNLDALLDENKAQRNLAQNNWRGDWHSVARIPLSMLHSKTEAVSDAVREGDTDWVRRFLNNSENEKLRTKDGRL